MRRSNFLLVMLLVVLLALSGCSRFRRARPTPTPERPPTQQPAVVRNPTATQEAISPTATRETISPPATERPRPTATAQPEPEPVATTPPAVEESLPLPEPGALTSYIAQIEFKEEEIEPSAKVVTWVTMETRYQSQPEPGAYAMTMTSKVEPAAGQQLQTVVTGEDVYIFSPEEGKWLKAPMGSSGLASMTENMLDPNRLAENAPADVFIRSNVVDAHEQVDGVDTTHYRIEGDSFEALLRSMGSNEYQPLDGQADLWVANDGGYLKQYHLDARVQGEDQRELRQTAALLVTEENANVQVNIPQPDQIIKVPLLEVTAEAPTAHQAELEELPAPPDSRPLSGDDLAPAVQGLLQGYLVNNQSSALYHSSASQGEIVQFYGTELPRLGWTELMSMPGNASGKRDLRLYEREGLNLLVAIVADETGAGQVVLLQLE